MSHKLYTLVSTRGYVGTFLTQEEVQQAKVPYPAIPFATFLFPRSEGQVEFVWAVFYPDIHMVAYISNDKDKATRVQHALSVIGLSEIEDIDYAKIPVGVIPEGVQDELKSWNTAMTTQLSTEEIAKLSRMDNTMSRDIAHDHETVIEFLGIDECEMEPAEQGGMEPVEQGPVEQGQGAIE